MEEKKKWKTLLQEACRLERLSSEVSSSEDNEGAQCSNLQAIVMVENESGRYVKPIIVTINTNTNNLFSRIEKERIKRRAKRYPSYGHISGKYPTFNNTHLPHVYLDCANLKIVKELITDIIETIFPTKVPPISPTKKGIGTT